MTKLQVKFLGEENNVPKVNLHPLIREKTKKHRQTCQVLYPHCGHECRPSLGPGSSEIHVFSVLVCECTSTFQGVPIKRDTV